MVLDGEIHKFQIGLDWDCCYFRKLLFTIIFMSQMLITRFRILTMLGTESPSYYKYLQPYYHHVSMTSNCSNYNLGQLSNWGCIALLPTTALWIIVESIM